MEKPKEPRPEDFGLTRDRLLLFNDPFPAASERITSVLIALAAVCGLIIGAYYYSSNKSVLGALFAFFFAFVGGIIGLALLNAIVESAVVAIWRRTQGDYHAYRSYEKDRAEYKRKLEGWLRHQESWWQSLDGRSFEAELARLLQRRGYDVRWTGASGDEGVDLILKQDDRRIAIQCKAHKNPVGPGPVRDLYGTLMHRKDTEAWLISTSGFSRGARMFARGKPLRLLTIGEILRDVQN